MAGAGIITIDRIQRATAQRFGVPVSWMREPAGTPKTQLRSVARPRQAAIALSFLLTDHSRVRIGHFFGGRDPTTVHHACRAVEKRRRADPKLHKLMREVTFDLLEQGAGV